MNKIFINDKLVARQRVFYLTIGGNREREQEGHEKEKSNLYTGEFETEFSGFLLPKKPKRSKIKTKNNDAQ